MELTAIGVGNNSLTIKHLCSIPSVLFIRCWCIFAHKGTIKRGQYKIKREKIFIIEKKRTEHRAQFYRGWYRRGENEGIKFLLYIYNILYIYNKVFYPTFLLLLRKLCSVLCAHLTKIQRRPYFQKIKIF